MNRLCRILCLACAVLLLLPSCQTRSLKNQDGSEADAALDSDPADTRSQDEILEELFAQTDGPVVVGWVPTTPILYKETAYPQLLNQPHVLDVLFVSLVHWLDISEEGSLCMIGQYYPDLDPAAISEGRWYETDTECCVNRAEYERLLADPESGFTGIGDTVTYTEPDFQLPIQKMFNLALMTEKERTALETTGTLVYREPISTSLTVVGIVGEEGKYADPAFGMRHVYALTDAVERMMANYEYDNENVYDSRLDKAIYQPSLVTATLYGMAVYQPSAEDPEKPVIRFAEDTLFTEEEHEAMFRDLVCNAGYTVEITLDSGKNYAAFVAAIRNTRYRTQTAGEREKQRLNNIELAYKTYEQNMESIKQEMSKNKEGVVYTDYSNVIHKYEMILERSLEKNKQDPTIARLEELGQLEEWYICAKACVTLRPLRVEE